MPRKPFRPLDPADLSDIVSRVGDAWRNLSGARLLMTGCTGFFGAWLVESLLEAQRTMGLELHAMLVTRDPEHFRRRMPHVADHSSVSLEAGDMEQFSIPDGFTHLVHGAASTQGPMDSADAMASGTRRVLDAARHGKVQRVLFVSSGAVYGSQPPDLDRIPEDHPLRPDSAYGLGKVRSEELCSRFHEETGVPVILARPFAFLAPHLPLDAHFAAGNFLADALKGGPLLVKGNGRPYRSYLYGTDLAAWLWILFLRGEARAYNVGSEQAVTVAQLAQEIAGITGTTVNIAESFGDGAPAPRYVPSTARARTELGLAQTVALPEAIRRTLRWHGSSSI